MSVTRTPAPSCPRGRDRTRARSNPHGVSPDTPEEAILGAGLEVGTDHRHVDTAAATILDCRATFAASQLPIVGLTVRVPAGVVGANQGSSPSY
jgi:hypothetical protein